MLALPLLALCLPTLPQAGGPPVTGPGGGALRLVDVSESGPTPLVLGAEPSATVSGVDQPHVYELDAAGDLSLVSSVPSTIEVSWTYALGDDRIIARVSSVPRVLERTGGTWVLGPALTPNPVGTYITYDRFVDLDGQRVAHRIPGSQSVDVRIDDLSVPGVLTTEASLPLPDGHLLIGLSLDQDLLVVSSGVPQFASGGWLTDIRVRAFERSPQGIWSALGTDLQPPAGVEWQDRSLLTVVASAGRIAVSGPVCGEAFVYERSPGGDFVLASRVGSARQLEVAPGRCSSIDTVNLRGDDLVLRTGADGAGERFRFDPALGWTPAETARTDRGTMNPYWFAGEYMVSEARSGGIQVHDRTSPRVGLEVTCPAPAHLSLLDVFVEPPATHGLAPLWVGAFSQQGSNSLVLIGGLQALARPLGPEAMLCVGGAVRRLPMPAFAPNNASLQLDLPAAGVPAGSTLHLQVFERIAGGQGWRSSAGYSVTLAP